MKLLTLIDKKVNNNIELTLDELKFLYEVNSKIDCFGYKKDPRIEEIKSKRNGRRDYSLIFNVKEEEVALSHEEWLNNPEKFKALSGNIYLRPLTSADGLVLPQYVGYDIDLRSLTSADGLVLPHYFDLNKLKCPYNIKEEIMNNPDKYYMEPPTEEDKKGIKR